MPANGSRIGMGCRAGIPVERGLVGSRIRGETPLLAIDPARESGQNEIRRRMYVRHASRSFMADDYSLDIVAGNETLQKSLFNTIASFSAT